MILCIKMPLKLCGTASSFVVALVERLVRTGTGHSVLRNDTIEQICACVRLCVHVYD